MWQLETIARIKREERHDRAKHRHDSIRDGSGIILVPSLQPRTLLYKNFFRDLNLGLRIKSTSSFVL